MVRNSFDVKSSNAKWEEALWRAVCLPFKQSLYSFIETISRCSIWNSLHFSPSMFFLFIYNWIFLSFFVLVFRSAHQHLNADTILFNIYSAGKINFRQTKLVINVNNFNCRTLWGGDEDSYSLGRSVFANRLRIPYAYVLVKRR